MSELTPNQQRVVDHVCAAGFIRERAIDLVRRADGAHNLGFDELYAAFIKLAFSDNTSATYGRNGDTPKLVAPNNPPEQPGNSQGETAATPRECNRAGISDEFLRRHNIRHIGKDEAARLTGYPVSGIVIPYTTLNGEPLMVNGRNFHRIRLDVPTSAKYLSPKGSGAHLFIPLGQVFGSELVIAESEFKAAALAEAGVPTVGIGGICSAMSEGRFIPELEQLTTKHPPKTVFLSR